MAVDPGPPPAVDELMGRMRQTVAERRARGEYPADLEERLDSHFNRIRRLRADEDVLEPVRVAVEELDRRSEFFLGNNLSSRLPLGEHYHKAIAESLRRQVDPLVEQIRAYADQLREVFKTLLSRLDDPGSHFHPDLVGQIDAALDRLGRLGSMPAGNFTRQGAGADRLAERFEFHPWYDIAEHETEVRGTVEEVRQRYRGLADKLSLSGPVLEIGCGRGEFLGLIVKQGTEVVGWEKDTSLAAVGRSTPLPVKDGSGLAALAETADASLGAVVVLRALERMSRQDLADVVALASSKLRPGGTLLVSGVEPESSHPLARSVRADLENVSQIYPEAVGFLCRQAHFESVSRLRFVPPEWAADHDGRALEDAPLFAVVASR